MTKDELLAAIRADRTALNALVGPLPLATLEARTCDTSWSIADHLAHIAAWHRMIVAHLTDRSAHTLAGMTSQQYATAPLDALNARLHDLHHDDPPALIRTEFAAAHDALLVFLDALPAGRLLEPYWGDDPPPHRTILDKVAGDSYLHDREHAAWIGKMLARPEDA